MTRYDVWAIPARVDLDMKRVCHDLEPELAGTHFEDRAEAIEAAGEWQDEHPMRQVFVVEAQGGASHPH